MAVKKIQMRPPDNNYADVLHPETDTTMVLLPDGSALQDQLVAPLASGSATALVIDMPGNHKLYTSQVVSIHSLCK